MFLWCTHYFQESIMKVKSFQLYPNILKCVTQISSQISSKKVSPKACWLYQPYTLKPPPKKCLSRSQLHIWVYGILRFIWPCKSDCQPFPQKMQGTFSLFVKLLLIRPLIFHRLILLLNIFQMSPSEQVSHFRWGRSYIITHSIGACL